MSGMNTGGGGGGGSRGEGSGESAASGTRVYRVYGSLADGTGPVSSVLLDRAKVIAAGRGSRRSGGGYVIRIYAVDSTRLLRTLRCLGEVSRMCLFDPVLAVLSSASGRISFRDLYADNGSGLGQVRQRRRRRRRRRRPTFRPPFFSRELERTEGAFSCSFFCRVCV
ncbi:unnamed protein product [Scytosiphon promiscuus]